MTVLEWVKADRIEAMKAKESGRASYLAYLVSGIYNIGKNDAKNPGRETTDAEAISFLQKEIRVSEETLAQAGSRPEQAAKLRGEIALARSYLPQQLSDDELRAAITAAIGDRPRSPKLMGAVMKDLNEKYAGRFDKAAASAIAKELLA